MLNDIEIDAYLYDAVKIDALDIKPEYIRLPGDIAYFAHQCALAVEAFLLAKAGLARIDARLKIEHRQKLSNVHAKVTESMVEQAVLLDGQYMVFEAALIDAETKKVRAFGVMEAVKAKRDIIQSLGAHIRKEMEADPVTRTRHAQQSEQDDYNRQRG